MGDLKMAFQVIPLLIRKGRKNIVPTLRSGTRLKNKVGEQPTIEGSEAKKFDIMREEVSYLHLEWLWFSLLFGNQ